MDDAKNKSKSAHINLVNAKINNLKDSLVDKFETYLFADGTGNGSKDPLGLKALVPAVPNSATTVGNITPSTNTWWLSKTKTATGSASVYLLTDMRTLFNTCSKGQKSDQPDLLVTDQTSYELYEDDVVEQKQIVNQSTGDPEFTTVTFRGQPLVWSADCTAGYMYMLNTKYISLVIDPDIDFAATEWKSIPNQLDRAMQIVTKLELVASRRKSLGVLITIAA